PRSALRASRSALRAQRRRRGYTLLEMILATLVSIVLLGALYKVMHTQIRYAQAGRDAIGESNLAHSLLAGISSDIKKCVIQVAPTPSSLSSAPPKDSSNPASDSSNPASGSSPTGSGSPSPSSSPAGTSSPSVTRDTIQFQLGVQGTPTTLS